MRSLPRTRACCRWVTAAECCVLEAHLPGGALRVSVHDDNPKLPDVGSSPAVTDEAGSNSTSPEGRPPASPPAPSLCAVDLSELLTAFPPDPGSAAPGSGGTSAPAPVREVVRELGGVSFARGLYRVLPAQSIRTWTDAATAAFPELRDRVTVFGVDWSGRLFAADAGRSDDDGQQRVLVLDPGAGEVHESRSTVAEMHTWELLEQPHALLRQPSYERWRLAADDEEPLSLSECVGYQVPLFLGGEDDASNQERTDLDVYWQLTGQLLRQVASLPDGSLVTGVTITDERPKRRWGLRR